MLLIWYRFMGLQRQLKIVSIHKVLVLYLCCQSLNTDWRQSQLVFCTAYTNTTSTWAVSILQSRVKAEGFTRVYSDCTLNRKSKIGYAKVIFTFSSVFLSLMIYKEVASLLSRIWICSIAVPLGLQWWCQACSVILQSAFVFRVDSNAGKSHVLHQLDSDFQV